MNKIRVLVAEDDEVNAKAARMMLEQLGCSGAAPILQMNPSTLRSRMRRLGIQLHKTSP